MTLSKIEKMKARASGTPNAVAQEAFIEGNFVDGWTAKIDDVSICHPVSGQSHFESEADALSAAIAYQDAVKRSLAELTATKEI